MTRRGRPPLRSPQRQAEREAIAARTPSQASHNGQEPPKPPGAPPGPDPRIGILEAALADAQAEIERLEDTVEVLQWRLLRSRVTGS